MKKKFLGFLDKRPLIWFHYVLLTSIVSILIFLMDKTVSPPMYRPFFENTNWYVAIPLLFLTISISDQLIHKLLGVD